MTPEMQKKMEKMARQLGNSDFIKYKTKYGITLDAYEKGFTAAHDIMQEKLKPLVEALKFYATRESWKYLGPMYGRTLIEDADLEQLPLDDRVTERTTATGGKRAREALKGWEG